MTARLTVDVSDERFGDAVTIAHLAQFSFEGQDSDALSIYRADAIISRDWAWEVESVEMEYLTGVRATFKDGSRLHVGAWAGCCRAGDPDYGNCHWCGGRYAQKGH